MTNAIDLYLFKDVSPLQIVLLIAIKIYSTGNVSPNVLIKIARLIEHKHVVTNDNQSLIVLSDLESVQKYFDDASCFDLLVQILQSIQSIEDLDQIMKEFKDLVNPEKLIENGKSLHPNHCLELSLYKYVHSTSSLNFSRPFTCINCWINFGE